MSDKPAFEKPLRILHIGKYFPPHRGGMETVLRDQMNIQARDEGLEVAAVVHSSERRLDDTVEITKFGYRVRRSARWFTAIFAPIAPLFWLSLLKEIRELNPEEIRIHMPNLSAFWLLLLPSARSCNWVILWHSDVVPSPSSWGLRSFYWLYRPLELALLKRAREIIATSSSYLESSKALARFRQKCVVEPLKLDAQRVPVWAAKAEPPSRGSMEGVRVLCVGRLTYYKDFGTAIRAVGLIPNAQLHIVGDGAKASSLKTLAAELGVKPRVTFFGAASDETLWREYVWCDVLCLPSIERTEAFGLVILEAALFGKPSVVANTKGSGMVFAARESHAGHKVFKPGDHHDLARILVQASTALNLPVSRT